MIKFHRVVFVVFGSWYAAGESPTGVADAGRYPPCYTLLARAYGLCSPPYPRIDDEHIAFASPIEASFSRPFERGVRGGHPESPNSFVSCSDDCNLPPPPLLSLSRALFRDESR